MLTVQNSLTRKKEVFETLEEGFVGMYVCGPTVYSDVHIGNCRTFISFDVIYRYLMHLGYKVRYVRNITDVGHLEGDVDTDAEDKIAKKARLEQLEPMEVVQRYTLGFHQMMKIFNTLPPNIEPRATGHIIEQIETIQKILQNGYAYEANGSVYFDTPKYIADGKSYGDLSGRVVEDLLQESRSNLKKQDEKRSPSDFALWIKADEKHIMRWPSPWSVGFPGWHLECSSMSTKYLGEHFDIHGGGNDLKFPHHENEIAQNVGSCGCTPAKYWIHTNMLLMNGKKMSKSDGNSITPTELLTGNSDHVSQGYDPMAIRFFMLQAHYSSTLDLSDQGLQAADKGYRRLMESQKILNGLESSSESGSLDAEIETLLQDLSTHMNDDFNTPRTLATLFELCTKINALKGGQLDLTQVSLGKLNDLKKTFNVFVVDILGLVATESRASGNGLVDGLMDLILDIRRDVREAKNWSTSDKIRDKLSALEVQVKDGKDGSSWTKV